jgi:hypothetical protein
MHSSDPETPTNAYRRSREAMSIDMARKDRPSIRNWMRSIEWEQFQGSVSPGPRHQPWTGRIGERGKETERVELVIAKGMPCLSFSHAFDNIDDI